MRKEESWVVLAKSADFQGIGAAYGVDPVIARIVRNREVVGEEALKAYFRPAPEHLNDPALLLGASAAADLLAEKIREKKKIRIIGDYDIDGVFSTYILYQGLTDCGAVVDYVLPHRINDGYGLNEKLIREAHAAGVDTLLTCDNGIAALREIALAKELGMTCIVTDHHEVPMELSEGRQVTVLPAADALVDPKQPGDAYPERGICGAVVAWKVLLLLQRKLGLDSDYRTYIAFAAFATIGDVMELQGENRTITALGLEALAHTDNVGLLALIRRCGLEPRQVRAYHVGFVIGPCINATGRLDTALRALELLLERDSARASLIAEELVSLNESRKELTAKGLEDAIAQTEERELWKQAVLVVYLPDCHESLAGIIAGRLRERYYRPVFVLTPGAEGIKGSGRSIPSYHMYEHMCHVSHLFSKFGGHAMAAGLSLAGEDVEELRRELNADAGLSPEDLTEKIRIDVPMPLTYISEPLIQQLSLLEPCGNGNEKPIFADRGLRARRAFFIGRERRMLKLSLFCGNGTMDALYFGDAEEFLDYYREKYGQNQVDALLAGRRQDISFDFIYYPQVNEYQGMRSLQIVISHYR
jgi:single-stranded-DNA-specific exonuclease